MINSIINFGRDIIRIIFPDKTEALKIEARLLEAEKNGKLADIKWRWQARIAESKNPDKWTSRAPVSIVYTICLFLILFIILGILFSITYVINPVIAQNFAAGMQLWISSLPNLQKILFDIFFTIIGFYFGHRSYNKRQKQRSASQ